MARGKKKKGAKSQATEDIKVQAHVRASVQEEGQDGGKQQNDHTDTKVKKKPTKAEIALMRERRKQKKKDKGTSQVVPSNSTSTGQSPEKGTTDRTKKKSRKRNESKEDKPKKKAEPKERKPASGDEEKSEEDCATLNEESLEDASNFQDDDHDEDGWINIDQGAKRVGGASNRQDTKTNAGTSMSTNNSKKGSFAILASDNESEEKEEEEEEQFLKLPKLRRPKKAGRTSLIANQEPAYNQDSSGPDDTPDSFEKLKSNRFLVLHLDKRKCPGDITRFDDLMGVYQRARMDQQGYPTFKRCPDQTEDLCKELSWCSQRARCRLEIDRGIFLESTEDEYTEDDNSIPARLETVRDSKGNLGWRVREENLQCAENHALDPFALCLTTFDDVMGPQLSGDADSLFFGHSNAFSVWTTPGREQVPIAISPLHTFEYAIELAEMRGSELKMMEAKEPPDFSFWDKPLVLHAEIAKASMPTEFISQWMGVYVPVEGAYHDGYPVWQRSDSQSNELADSLAASGEDVTETLESLGISLLQSRDDFSPLMYMYRHVLHLVHETLSGKFERKPSKGFSLRNTSVSPHEEALLTKPAALLDIGKEAFAHWTICFEGKWLDIDVAVTPKEHFLASVVKLKEMAAVRAAERTNGRQSQTSKRRQCQGPEESAKHGSAPPLEQAHQIEVNNEKALAAEKLCSSLIEGLRSQNVVSSLLVEQFFNPYSADPPFLQVDESMAASFYSSCLESDPLVVADGTKRWLCSSIDGIIALAIAAGLRQFVLLVLQRGKVTISAKNLISLLNSLPEDRCDDFNNRIARAVSAIKLASKSEKDTLFDSVSGRVGKSAKKHLFAVLKEAEKEFSRSKRTGKKGRRRTSNRSHAYKPTAEFDCESLPTVGSGTGDTNLKTRIEDAVDWYRDLFDKYRMGIDINDDNNESDLEEDLADVENEMSCERMPCARDQLPPSKEGSTKVVRTKLPDCEQDLIVSNLDNNLDLEDWGRDSEWTVEITEHAHKWFRKHTKRQHLLCDRIMRRLKMLSTGRWPYALCKPLRTTKSQSKLYESKIDKACRIIWEVAISFSPRRSRANFSCCEQVIRVWDIVLDHDNLTRAIALAVARIEKSNIRGQDCSLYSVLEDYDGSAVDDSSIHTNGQHLPRVFSIQQGSQDDPVVQKYRCFPPASDDPDQFGLIKFYELNSRAIELLLAPHERSPDLPFTPGPKEHEIIHYASNPERSILLMGRSGTGKTTCLVFRMWAQFMAFSEAEGLQPRQLFVTKSNVLRKEVEKCFTSMSHAWKKRGDCARTMYSSTNAGTNNDSTTSPDTYDLRSPIFLSSKQWLELLDSELPGEHFFTVGELNDRVTSQEDDPLQGKVQAFLAGGGKECMSPNKGVKRVELTFKVFHEKWHKINSKSKSCLDPALVWLEIKSHIKGSLKALHIDQPNEERSQPQNRFLTLEEYLALPRKVSRLDEANRRILYELYEVYERIKREGNHYDEMDLVYNLAGRVSLLHQDPHAGDGDIVTPNRLLPIDSLYVDEVQDFTQAELYLLTKLSRDPNNLMLAGDTAQSIAVGVSFRFTDVRQLFFEELGGTEPALLQLTHNYRSHAGILRLAACVVELLYFFFKESLDHLPPDLGLLNGPQPVIVETQSAAELVLLLEGSKRETSKIEFGAHQVVIVRSDEAKQALSDMVGVDKDWIMTVEESKGLEFDDVFIYNFFTDSRAADMWRTVSNYKEGEIAEYYNSTPVTSSGIQSYEWDELTASKTRPLEFSQEKHKILESELKMLYTAITRARANVFLAESNSELCRPMFEYFTQRRVAEVAKTNKDGDMAGVRVFGKMSSPEDWRARGEYYMQNAHGGGRKGRLRLASKCFEKAGEIKRRDYALALLSYLELEGQEDQQGAGADVEQLHTVALKLLEAEDVDLLSKAAYCMVQAGDNLLGAEMLELSALLYCAKRASGHELKLGRVPPTAHEQQQFSSAGKLFQKCSDLREAADCDKGYLLVRAMENYLRSGSSKDLDLVSLVLERKSDLLLRTSPKGLVTIREMVLEMSQMTDNHASCQALLDQLGRLQASITIARYFRSWRGRRMSSWDAVDTTR